jgi:hypothetical protein
MNIVTNFGFKVLEVVSNLTPKNPYLIKAKEIENKITENSQALVNQNNNNPIFREKYTQIGTELQSQKQEHERKLLELNGRYFKDSQSTLKQAWDAAVEKVREVLNMPVKTRNDLTKAQQTIDSFTYLDASKEQASQSIDHYVTLEKKRDQLKALLHEVIRTEKATLGEALNASLRGQIKTLEARQLVLCGNHYRDPKSLLDQTWKLHTQALAKKNASEAAKHLGTFRGLEEERKNNVAKIFELKKQLLLSQGPHNITSLTSQQIREEISTLNSDLEKTIEKSKQSVLPELDFTM